MLHITFICISQSFGFCCIYCWIHWLRNPTAMHNMCIIEIVVPVCRFGLSCTLSFNTSSDYCKHIYFFGFCTVNTFLGIIFHTFHSTANINVFPGFVSDRMFSWSLPKKIIIWRGIGFLLSYSSFFVLHKV